jgi:hypothetical protein
MEGPSVSRGLTHEQQIQYLDKLLEQANVGGGPVLMKKVLKKKQCLLKLMKVKSMMLEVGHLLSSNFLWTDINSFQHVCEVFCDVQGPQSDHNFSGMVIIFQKIFDNELVELIMVQTNLYVQKEVYSSMCDFRGMI